MPIKYCTLDKMKCYYSTSSFTFVLLSVIYFVHFSSLILSTTAFVSVTKPLIVTRYDSVVSSLNAFSGRNNKKKEEELDQSDQDAFTRFTKAQRFAGADDRIVEIRKPLGLVLNQDDDTGNVYVEIVAPKGNAARTGMVKEGDIITMCSATFGDEMWSW